MIRPSGVPLPWRCRSRRLRRGSLQIRHHLELGCHQQEGTAAADHTGLPAVVRNRPPVRSLAVGHSPVVVGHRRSLAAVRDPAETLNSRVCISTYKSKLNKIGRRC
jgi:hypothetical protein